MVGLIKINFCINFHNHKEEGGNLKAYIDLIYSDQ